MKSRSKKWVSSVLLLCGVLASGPAMAQRFGYWHGGHARFGIHFGVPFYGPGYYPPHFFAAPVYVYPPAVVMQATPPVYVEQGTAQAAPAPAQPQGDWYYCADSRTYYPYVMECAGEWQRVPALPPSLR